MAGHREGPHIGSPGAQSGEEKMAQFHIEKLKELGYSVSVTKPLQNEMQQKV